MGNDGSLDDIFECKIERKAGCIKQKMDSASRSVASGRCLTAITVTSSAKDSYALPLKTIDELQHAVSGVFRSVFGHPQGIVKSSLNAGSY
jgi:hypothetical protein